MLLQCRWCCYSACYSAFPVPLQFLLQCCYSVVTVPLHCCYSAVTVPVGARYSACKSACYSAVVVPVTVPLQCCYSACYSAVTELLQCCYSACHRAVTVPVTVLLQSCYSAVTVLLQCMSQSCYSAVTVHVTELLQCRYRPVTVTVTVPVTVLLQCLSQCCYSAVTVPVTVLLQFLFLSQDMADIAVPQYIAVTRTLGDLSWLGTWLRKHAGCSAQFRYKGLRDVLKKPSSTLCNCVTRRRKKKPQTPGNISMIIRIRITPTLHLKCHFGPIL